MATWGILYTTRALLKFSTFASEALLLRLLLLLIEIDGLSLAMHQDRQDL